MAAHVPVFNLVVNDDGVLKELALLDEVQARELLEFLEAWLTDPEEMPETPEAVEEIATALRAWLGED